jgi:serine/threonine-protein kinase
VRFYHKIGNLQDGLLGNPSEARQSFQMAVQIADSIPRKTGDPAYRARAEAARWMGGLDFLRNITEHRRWMEKSLALARQWSAAEPGPESAFFEASVTRQVGDNFWQMGDLDEAMRRSLEAVRLMERLLRQQPENVNWQQEKAIHYEYAGLIAGHPMYFNLGDHSTATYWLEKMNAIFERLAAADATDMRAQFSLSEALAELASSLRETDAARAERLYRRSLALNAAIVRSKPDDRLAPRWQAFNRTGLAWLLSRTGHRPEAVDELKKAVAIQETYVQRDPEDVLFRQELAVTLTALGSARGKLRDPAAGADLDRALAILTSLRQHNPRKLTLLRDLADCYEAMGNARTEAADWDGATAWYKRSRDLWDTWPSSAVTSVYDAGQRKRLTTLFEQAARKAKSASRDR